MAAGATGGGEERYGIYLPFELPVGRKLGVEPGGSRVEIANTQLTVEQLHHRYAIHGGEFSSHHEAEALLNSLRSSLLWVSLTHRLGLRCPEVISNCSFYEQPIKISSENKATSFLLERGWTEIHGDFNADEAIVKPQHLCVTRWEEGRCGVITGLAVDQFASTMDHAHQLRNLEGLGLHPKIRLAIEVYASAQFETSDQAQFLVLVAALEATLESQRVSDSVMRAIEAATAAVKGMGNITDGDTHVTDQTSQFLSRLQGLKEASIAQKFREQVAIKGGELDPWKSGGDLGNELKEVYNTRSRLLHDGTSEHERVKSGLAFLGEFVPAYLAKEFERVASEL